VAGVVDLLHRRGVVGDALDLHAGEHVAEARARRLLEEHLLALVRLAVRALRGVRVGEILRDHVHAQPLGAHAGRGDPQCAEQAPQRPPITLESIWSRAWATATSVWYSTAFSLRFAIS